MPSIRPPLQIFIAYIHSFTVERYIYKAYRKNIASPHALPIFIDIINDIKHLSQRLWRRHRLRYAFLPSSSSSRCVLWYINFLAWLDKSAYPILVAAHSLHKPKWLKGFSPQPKTAWTIHNVISWLYTNNVLTNKKHLLCFETPRSEMDELT